MVKSLLTYFIVFCSLLTNAQEASQFNVKQIEVPLNGDMYSPAFWKSSLVLCGTRKDRIAHTHLDKDGTEPIDLYVLNLDSSFSSGRFDKKFRSDFHDGPISFNDSGNVCIVSRNLRIDHQFKALQEDENLLGLFISTFENDEWSSPRSMSVNNSSYNCTHPALSADGNTLVFSSNMPGGMGGYDLWIIEKVSGIWGEPVNFGSEINTSSNEFFPTWIGNMLYFSSNRKAYGGLDIYQADGVGVMASTKLMGEPLNSAGDDFGLISRTQGKSGFFSSNRNGSDGLWSFEMLFPDFEGCDSIVDDDFCYTLLEETAYGLGGIDALVYRWDINGVNKYGYEIDYCFPGPGVYEISVDIYDTIIKKTYANQASYTLELANEEQPYISSPDSVKLGQEFYLNPLRSFLPGVEIGSYYWIFSDGTLFTTRNPSHSFEKEGSYQVTLGIVGTRYGEPFKDCSYKYIVASNDATGYSDTINEANTDYNAAITAQDIRPMGAFEDGGQIVDSEPPLENTDSAAVVHSIEFARTETQLSDTNAFLSPISDHYIVNTLFDPTDSTYVYSVGQWLNIGEAHETWVEIVKLGYEDATIYSVQRDSLNDLPLNQSFTLENIEFETNEWEVTDETKEKLEILVLLLKEFEGVRLLISAHTDDVGQDEDNLLLSTKRASAISDYLVETGIDRSRLENRGFGETRPKFDNETEEGRAKNRRVDFKLISSNEVEIIPE
ncbi:MAG: OmpA family protein [Crocinitomicaceae bacterium]|nr:OmpA family protein [Crocinitomicaceae bacterium]